jgi:carbon-monoxide dehydrogenase medium subunit
MYETTYHRARSLEDAAARLGAGEEPKLLAGGQTLLPTMKQHLAAPTDLIDLRGVAELRGVTAEGETLAIGATTTHAEVSADPEVLRLCPALACVAAGIGDPAVRHMGTIGGSLANNDPAADYPAAILGLAGTIVTDKREIAADDFFEGLFTTALEEDEIIARVKVPACAEAAYAKFRNPASRYAMTGVMVARTGGGVRVAVTGAGEDGVFRHEGLEAALSADFSAAAVDGVEIAAEGLMSDIHGDAEYRANLIRVMTKRALAAI